MAPIPKAGNVNVGSLFVARLMAAFIALALVVASAAAQKVYVYEVESDVGMSLENVPHVPGISWRFGEQALVVLVPRDSEPGILLFTNETVQVPVYDRSYFLLVIPANARPSQRAKAEAFLRTPDGVYPVVLRKPDKGIIDITAHSIEDALTILKQLGLEPEFRGRAELRKTTEKAPAETAAALSQATRPSIGSILDVYGGLYFRQVAVTRTSRIDIPVHGNQAACANILNSAYVGYDASSFVIGTLIKGGRVDADLVVEVYRIGIDGFCQYLGSRSFTLGNRSRYYVDLVNPTNSVDQLAVVVYLNVRSFSGQPMIGVNASVRYTRTYRYGFEVGEFAARTTGSSGYTIYNYVGRIVIGPYAAYDGYVAQTASSSLALAISTDPVNGLCKDMAVTFRINGFSSSGTYIYAGGYNGFACVYNVYLPSLSQWAFQTEYSYAKAFGGGLSWVLDVRYTDGSTPYVRVIHLGNADAFRYWRWAEQWKTVSTGIDGIWAAPFLSSAFQLYVAPVEQPAAPGIYHGLVTVRANAAGQTLGRVVLTISGRYVYPGLNRVTHIRKAKVDLSVPLPVQGSDAFGESYLMNYRINLIAPPQWVEMALRIKDAIGFILTAAGIGGRAVGLLSFVAGKGLESAGDSVRVQVLDYNTLKIIYQRSWGKYVHYDTIIIPLYIPSLSGRRVPTELEVRQVCLDGFCVTPGLKAYVQPDTGYAPSPHVPVKNWMFRGQVAYTTAYETGASQPD